MKEKPLSKMEVDIVSTGHQLIRISRASEPITFGLRGAVVRSDGKAIPPPKISVRK